MNSSPWLRRPDHATSSNAIALEMALIHDAMMRMAISLPHTETVPQQESVANALNKLARTFALQLEALKRWRSTGQQQVVIKRIEVKEGGQAMVGAIGSEHASEGGTGTDRARASRRPPQHALPPPDARDRMELPIPMAPHPVEEPVAIDARLAPNKHRAPEAARALDDASEPETNVLTIGPEDMRPI